MCIQEVMPPIGCNLELKEKEDINRKIKEYIMNCEYIHPRVKLIVLKGVLKSIYGNDKSRKRTA